MECGDPAPLSGVRATSRIGKSDELELVVQSGAGTVRAGAASYPVATGEVFVHPPGEPHQLINTGTVDLEVLIIADNPPLDAFHYPDSDQWGIRAPRKFFRMGEIDYWDGEE